MRVRAKVALSQNSILQNSILWFSGVGELTFDVGETTSYVGELTRWRNDRLPVRRIHFFVIIEKKIRKNNSQITDVTGLSFS